MSEAPSIFDQVNDKVQLAQTYFEDGAPLGAARCLRQAADILEAHGNAVNAELDALAAKAGAS